MRLIALALATCLMAACAEVEEPGPTVVALGDSGTSGPGIIPTENGPCKRSKRNYPALVADELNGELIDVSCPSARTRHVTEPQFPGIAPQADAITADTDIVLISLGLNNFRIFTRMLGCSYPDLDDLCEDMKATELSQWKRQLDQVAVRIDEVIKLVHERSPGAEVVLLSYPRFVDSGCEEFPMEDDVVATVKLIQEYSTWTYQRLAHLHGIKFVDMYQRSNGHDICSDDPWINGAEDVPGDGVNRHPNSEFHKAAAKAIVAALDRVE